MAAGPADKVLDTFKTLVFDRLVDLAIAQIIGLAPFLAFGPIAFIIRKVVVYITDKLYAGLQETINFQYVLLKNAQLHKAYVDASANIRDIAKAKGIDSPEFRKARDEHKIALAKFVRYTGT